MVQRDPAGQRLLAHPVDEGLARGRLRHPVLRPAVHQPRDRAPSPAAGDGDPEPARPAGAGARRDRALSALAPAAGRRRARPDRRPKCQWQLAGIPAVAQQRWDPVRDPRAAVRTRSRLLHLRSAVAPVPAGLAVLLADRGHAARRDRARAVGRDPPAGAGVRRQGDAGRPGAPVRAARSRDAGEGVGLLAGPLRPADVAARGRRGRLLHGGARTAAGAQLPRDRGDHLRDPVLPQHPAEAVEPAGDRRRSARDRVGVARHGLPGVHPAVQGQAEGAAAGAALHRGQHRRDTPGVRSGGDRPAGAHRHRAGADDLGDPLQPHHRVEHPPVASGRAPEELRVLPAGPGVSTTSSTWTSTGTRSGRTATPAC